AAAGDLQVRRCRPGQGHGARRRAAQARGAVQAVTADGTSEIDTETLLKRVAEIINNTRSIPLSSSVKLDNKDELLELLDEALQRLPDELRQARWMLKEREEFLAKTQRDADDLLESARVQAERMVQRTEIVRQAQHTAQRTVEQANDDARRLRLEAEDYC